MTISWRTAWVCLVVAVCRISDAAPPGELAGNTLPVIPDEEVTYRVCETHFKTGGILPGQYEFRSRLGLSVDRQELKLKAEQYEGTPIVPLAAQTIDFRYTATRAGGERHELDDRQMRLSGHWGYAADNQRFKGQWDTARARFKFQEYSGSRPSPRTAHLAGVWVPALVVDFPERLKVEEKFSWGEAPEQAPRRLEHLCTLQQWTVAGVEEIDGGQRLTLVAECKAEPDEDGQRASLKRQVVYDLGRKLVVSATVAFETHADQESETVQLKMELDEQQ